MKKEMLDIFKRYLQEEERSSATQEKYLYEVMQFFVWLGDEEVTKEIIVKWKQYLIQKGYKPSTIIRPVPRCDWAVRLQSQTSEAAAPLVSRG